MIFEMSEHNKNKAEAIFDGWQETLIWSCLQNIMGHIYVNHSENPTAAMAILGDFCFLAGMPDKELAAYKPEWCSQDFMIMVPESDEWAALIVDCYQEKAKKVTRYAIKKEKDIFDKTYLQAVVDGLPDNYKIKMIDEQLFHQCNEISWCRDWVSQYDSYALYQKHGLGAVILKGDEIVSGASSYSGYLGGIEIEIDTREDYRRQGLAFAAGAKLILECLNRDWYPSWDAQNKWSVALAEKLGYHYSHDYTAYEISGYQNEKRQGYSMNIRFRQGTMEDLDAITALVADAIVQMESQGIMQWDEIYPAREDFRADIEAGNLYVGYDKEEPAVIYVLSQEFDEEYKNGKWEDETKSFYVLHRLCVHPKYQNQGIAGTVMEHIEKTLKAQGIEAVRLDAFTKNPYALKLYERCGYHNVGMAHWRKGDFYLMEKYL